MTRLQLGIGPSFERCLHLFHSLTTLLYPATGLCGPAVMSSAPELLSKLDSLLPDKLKNYDAFPKLPSAYKARSQSRGFLTVFIALITALLLLNDLSEYVYGWTDFEFGVDTDPVTTGPHSGRGSRQADKSNWMNVNVDMVVNMPCRCMYTSTLLILVLTITK